MILGFETEHSHAQEEQSSSEVQAELGLTDPSVSAFPGDLRLSAASRNPSLLDAHRPGINDVPNGRHPIETAPGAIR
jgi:hypothetical protein